MTDESKLQVTLKDDTSSLVLSPARSRLIARGRSDAAALGVRCNRCGEIRDLVFAGRVCASCSNALDRQWETSSATDWVLITNLESEQQKQRDQEVRNIMKALKDSLAIAKGEEVRDQGKAPIPAAKVNPRRHIFRNTTYKQMKLRWAHQEPPDGSTFDHYCLGPMTAEEMVRAMATSNSLPYIRPAIREEIAEQRNALRSRVISDVFEKWGLNDEGQPLDSRWDTMAKERALISASEEIRIRLEEQGLEYGDAELGEFERP